jgi:hypothetical protein
VQAAAQRRQGQAAPFPDEERRTQGFLQQPHLPAHRAMGDVQFLRSAAHALQSGHGLEGAQGIQRWQVPEHEA